MSEPAVLLDTGPLVALLNRREAHHAWSVSQFEALPFPFQTCEAVLAEAAHLCGKLGVSRAVVLDVVRTGVVRVDCAVQRDAEAIQRLMRQYADLPMDLADACLLALSERYPQARVLTLDSDFFVYRRSDGPAPPVVHPVLS